MSKPYKLSNTMDTLSKPYKTSNNTDTMSKPYKTSNNTDTMSKLYKTSNTTDTMSKSYKTSNTTAMMHTLNNVLYLCGLRRFWIEPESFPPRFVRKYDVISKILNVMTCGYSLLVLFAFATQKDMSMKQQSDSVVHLVNPFSHFYYLVFLYHRRIVREILYRLMIGLKEDQNDEAVEKQMIRTFKLYMAVYLGSGLWMLIIFALYGVYQKIHSGMPFITIITAWPDIRDESTKAEVARFIFYGYWWISYMRLSGAYIILLSILISLSNQYKNLQCYFLGLEKIFSQNLSQMEKEEKYEKAFIKGIQMHSETIWCLKEIKHVFRAVFNAHLILGLVVFVSLLSVLLNAERNMGIVMAKMPEVGISLILMGFFMWNAGDISVEASILPDAMYCSGWEDCYYRSSCIRKLVVNAISQAQQPVTLTALGFIELSYNGYLRIINTAHSVFSVFY